MADSKCPKCDSTSFEQKDAKIAGAKFQYRFIQCAACGAVVGLIDNMHVPSLLTQILAKVNTLR